MSDDVEKRREKADVDYVKDVCDLISDRFDTIQVFASRVEADGTTTTVVWGVGNIFARYGQARVWVMDFIEESSDD
jgi:hypothetical protein